MLKPSRLLSPREQNLDNQNETISMDIKDINILIPKNITDENESIPKDKEENNEEILENLDDINNVTIKELFSVVDANNQFTFELYLELIKNDKENKTINTMIRFILKISLIIIIDNIYFHFLI